MEFGINKKKIKVVWLCHFANQEIKDYFNTPAVNEMAPWINKLIDLFRACTDIELHIVAPNVFNNIDCNFNKENIYYHFYKHSPIPNKYKYLRKIYSLLQIEIKTNFSWVKHKVFNNINVINPNIIHLHGAENPYYSAGIIPLFNNYPILTTIQGFVRNSLIIDTKTKKRIEIEDTILKNIRHIAVRTNEMSKIALQINPETTLHFHNYPIDIPSVLKNNIGGTEPIDCLFFARINKDKGIEDLLIAISIVKKSIPNISLSVIGSANKKYQSHLTTLCSKLDIVNNVKFLGFLATQIDIYKIALQAKMCVLPTYHDIIPGTIIESMFIKLPVIAYAVGGIPELNKNGNTVTLVDKKNIEQLAEKIIQLLNNSELRKTLAERAYKHAHEQFNNNNIVADIVCAYKSILTENKT